MPMRYPLALKQIRTKRGLKQAEVAAMIDVEQPTYQRWETGKRIPDTNALQKLAEALGVSPGELFNASAVVPIGPRLFVKGAVAAGVWREAVQWVEDDWQSFSGRSDLAIPLDARFGLRVEGESMNEIYPPGTIVECVAVESAGELTSGKRVVVVRTRTDGEHESTVKEYVVDEAGDEWLVPRSYNPAFQRAIKLREPDPDIDEVRIIAVVVGSYRPE